MIYYLTLVATEVILCYETALNLVLACNLVIAEKRDRTLYLSLND